MPTPFLHRPGVGDCVIRRGWVAAHLAPGNTSQHRAYEVFYLPFLRRLDLTFFFLTIGLRLGSLALSALFFCSHSRFAQHDGIDFGFSMHVGVGRASTTLPWFFFFSFSTLTSILAGICIATRGCRPANFHQWRLCPPDYLRFLRSFFFATITGADKRRNQASSCPAKLFFLLWLLGNRQTGRRPGFWTDGPWTGWRSMGGYRPCGGCWMDG